jgi:hypothetical protein
MSIFGKKGGVAEKANIKRKVYGVYTPPKGKAAPVNSWPPSTPIKPNKTPIVKPYNSLVSEEVDSAPFIPHKFDTRIELTTKASIRVSRKAFEDMRLFVGLCKEEIGWLGAVNREKYIFSIEEVFLLDQEVEGAEANITTNGLANLGAELMERDDCARVWNSLRFWGHSHVRMSTTPSSQDETQYGKLIKAVIEPNSANNYFIRGILNKEGRMQFDIFIYRPLVIIWDAPWSVYEPGNDPRKLEVESMIKDRVVRKTYATHAYTTAYPTGYEHDERYYNTPVVVPGTNQTTVAGNSAAAGAEEEEPYDDSLGVAVANAAAAKAVSALGPTKDLGTVPASPSAKEKKPPPAPALEEPTFDEIIKELSGLKEELAGLTPERRQKTIDTRVEQLVQTIENGSNKLKAEYVARQDELSAQLQKIYSDTADTENAAETDVPAMIGSNPDDIEDEKTGKKKACRICEDNIGEKEEVGVLAKFKEIGFAKPPIKLCKECLDLEIKLAAENDLSLGNGPKRLPFVCCFCKKQLTPQECEEQYDLWIGSGWIEGDLRAASCLACRKKHEEERAEKIKQKKEAKK